MSTAAPKTLQGPSEFFSSTEIAELKTLSTPHAWWLIMHCWGVVFATWVVVGLWTNPITVLLGIMIVGCRQLGFGVLSHDGAHFTLFRNRKLNDWASQWLLSRALVGGSIDAYRDYHLKHHRYTQQPEDPDLPLSAPFPLSRDSFRRKVLRDLSGRTGCKQYGASIRQAFSSKEGSYRDGFLCGCKRLGPNILINLLFFAGFSLSGHWYLYFLLWWVPALTWNRLITRIRNIGEHGAVPDNDDRLRNTRTTLTNWIERAFIAPYYVNYHLEHHLLVMCPCYNLPKAHEVLKRNGLCERMEMQKSYLAMLRVAVPA